MKAGVIGLLLGGILGAAAGFGLGIIAFPYLFPPPPVHETVADREQRAVLARGEFSHADPADPVHHGRGGVTVFDGLLHLEADFAVGPGPKFHVYLVPEAEITPDTAVDRSMYVDLGRLKAFEGSQNYAIPDGVNPLDYGSVVIWCEQFGVLISPARIVPEA